MEAALRALRDQLLRQNPELLQVTEKAYVSRIASLQSEIAEYVAAHPESVSLIVPPLEVAITPAAGAALPHP
jgi:hypothetical protein